MSYQPTTAPVEYIILQLVLCILIVLFSSTAMAEADSPIATSRSISFSNTAIPDKLSRQEGLKQSPVVVSNKSSGDGFRSESIGTEYYSSDFLIYDVSSNLISDYNYNGFYHRFSISIDADTLYETALVYARLYISYEGGPWDYYASSDVYSIYGDSGMDGFSIETELANGFMPAYYDIRIELYAADTDQLLLSYGPYNDISLSALPLEDGDYDAAYRAASYQNYNGRHIEYGQGSMGGGILLILFMIPLLRKISHQIKWPVSLLTVSRPSEIIKIFFA